MNCLHKCLDILYPKTCCFCGEVSAEDICNKCRKNIVYIQEPVCKKCGKPIRYEEGELCHDCQNNDFSYEQGKSIWLHKGPVRNSIYRFKYNNKRIYGKFYAEELYRLYQHKIKEWDIDVIIPIPLHQRRRRERGYNQSEIVAKYLGELAGIPIERKVLCRIRNTKPQKSLNHKDRKANLKNAFRAKGDLKKIKNILLIDDIYTTGNTIHEATKALQKKGALKVFFFTISIGQGF